VLQTRREETIHATDCRYLACRVRPDEPEIPAPEASIEQLVVADGLIVDEISIDGMCAVY
jgi:mycofactocin precursor